MVVYLSEKTAFLKQRCKPPLGQRVRSLQECYYLRLFLASSNVLWDAEISTLSCRAASTATGESPSTYSLGYKDRTVTFNHRIIDVGKDL